MTNDIMLSICISTLNRCDFISETLDSILPQLKVGVELVVVDGASSDHTHEVMEQYLSKCAQVRYYKEAKNSGVDGDYDKAVGYARGEFCWLMTDDDLLLPGAVEQVLASINNEVDLIIANAEIRSAKLTTILQDKLISLPENRKFSSGEAEAFFKLTAQGLSFIGCVVIRRNVWLARDRSSYYGTLFVHMGVIFQSPAIDHATIIAKPLILIRYGNAMWTSRSFEIWMFRWPDLIWSFDGFTDESKAVVSLREPWRRLFNLCTYRALGAYSFTEYRKNIACRSDFLSQLMLILVAVIPASLMNASLSLYVLLRSGSHVGIYDLVKSRHSTWITHFVANKMGIGDSK